MLHSVNIVYKVQVKNAQCALSTLRVTMIAFSMASVLETYLICPSFDFLYMFQNIKQFSIGAFKAISNGLNLNAFEGDFKYLL